MGGRMTVGMLVASTAVGYALRKLVRHRGPRHQDESDDDAIRHRIVIPGAGFGGVAAALELDRCLGSDPSVSVFVIDNDSGMLFTPLLWMVADGRASPTNVVVPVREFQNHRRFHLLHAEVEDIDLARRVVRTSAGSRDYDTLVIALGSFTALPDLPGLREHAHVFRTPADAIELRNHLITALEAAHRSDDPAERRAWLTFVVGGGGDTGVELAATIHDYLYAGLMAEYPWLNDEPVRIVVVGRAERLVPMSDSRSSRAVRSTLETEGIEIRTGVSVEAVTDRIVRTSVGEIPARTMFWAAGITAPPVVHNLPVDHAGNGAIEVDDRLCVPGHPEVFVIGDSAWAFDAATRAPVPPTAQAARHEGRYAARVIADRLRGREPPPFRFSPLGHLALLGRHAGVGRIGPVIVTGLPGWLLWHAYYLYRIPSWRNRARLLMDWLLAGVVGRQTAQIRLRDEEP